MTEKDNTNSGRHNSGRYNSGVYNSGEFNSGNRNSGDFNSGRFNSGDFNSGRFNSGRFNSGDFNSGEFNSGDFNSGDFNSGHFNRDTPPTIRVFEKEIPREVWDEAPKPRFLHHVRVVVDWESIPYKDAWARAWAVRADDDEARLRALPGFDAEIFRDITGIDLTEDGRQRKLDRIAAIEQELAGLKREVEG